MDIRYPVGLFQHEGEITTDQIQTWVKEIEAAPSLLRNVVEGLHDQQLNTPYRSGGWTIRQVVHHLADSHMNSYIRFKLALTEHQPTIKPYREEKWAELPDSHMPIEVSLSLLEALHQRWVHLLSHLSSAELKRTFFHPESGEIQLAWNIGLYAWHGRHHIAQITTLRNRMGW